MKKVLKSALPVLLTIATLSACTRGARTTSGHFINAAASTGTSVSTSDPNIHSSGTVGGNVKLAGVTTSSEVEIWFLSYPGTTGTFTLDNVNRGIIYGYTSDTAVCVSGTLTITSVTPDVVGTFSYTRNDMSTVTGSFNVPAP